MTVQEALRNIDIVVSNVQMKREEHAALQESISIIAGRCEVADRLEGAALEAAKVSLDKENAKLEAKNTKLREEKKNGSTNKSIKLPRANKKSR